MSIKEQDHLKNDITEWVVRYGRDRSALIPILHAVQDKYHFISDSAMNEIAEQLGIFPSEVQGVVTFYAFFNRKPKGKTVIHLCNCLSCRMAGGDAVKRQLEKDLGIKVGETRKDGRYTLEETSCIGMCDQAPAMLVNGKPYTQLKPDTVYAVVQHAEKSMHPDIIETQHFNEIALTGISQQTGLKKALDLTPQAVIEMIMTAKLRGSGGAGFPTGLKLKLANEAKGTEKYVVCNADEGEPGTFKDRHSLTYYPSLVFAGMAIVGHTIGAQQGILYLRAEYRYLLPRLEATLDQLRKEHLIGKNILGTSFHFDVQIRLGAGAYVCGEETALIESLEGRRGEPRNRPPFPIQAGYQQHPTCVNNVETFCWITAILEKGADWFSAVGTEKSGGYKLFSISGDCKKPGVYQFPMGTTIHDMLKAVVGEGAKAVQAGGASGQCIPASEFHRKLAFEDAPPGGSIVIIGQQRNMLEVAENFMEFFVEESCGQCTPCREGNPKILEGIRLLKQGKCSLSQLNHLIALGDAMKDCSKCGQGQSSANAFLGIIKHFKTEIMGSYQ